jgi:hypothetical protein
MSVRNKRTGLPVDSNNETAVRSQGLAPESDGEIHLRYLADTGSSSQPLAGKSTWHTVAGRCSFKSARKEMAIGTVSKCPCKQSRRIPRWAPTLAS